MLVPCGLLVGGFTRSVREWLVVLDHLLLMVMLAFV